MRPLVAIAGLAIGLFLAHFPTALAENFDGITIIQVSDNAVHDAILGRSGSVSTIVTFMSAAGSYAAVGDGNSRHCVAWAVADSYTGRSVTFGLPPSEQSLKTVKPQVCQPFTLVSAGEDRVRVETRNRHGVSGPLGPHAREVRYSAEHEVLARIPLIAFDWGRPVFTRYEVKGVRLGPMPIVRERVGAGSKFDLGQLQPTSSGTAKSLRITMPRQSGSPDPVTVNGRVAAAEVLGWPWDVLYAAEFHAYLLGRSSTEAFDRDATELYGSPNRIVPEAEAGSRVQQWFFNLDEIGLSPVLAPTAKCLATERYWIHLGDPKIVPGDIGPWGCALIMSLTDDGQRGSIGSYRVQAVSGYAMALNHFLMRVREVDAMKEKIEGSPTYRSKLE